MLDTPDARSDPSASKKGTKIMTKNMRLLLSAGSVAILAISALQGCGSDDPAPAGGAGAPGAGAPGAGAPGAGAGGAATAGAPSAGAGGTVTAGAGGGAAAGTGGTAAGAGGTGGGAAGTGGTGGGAAGTGGGGGAPSADCSAFCTLEESLCKFTGDIAAYASSAACLSACAGFAPGDASNSGDTFACRKYHLDNAAANNGAGKTTHCPHTGLVSKNNITDATATGPCK